MEACGRLVATGKKAGLPLRTRVSLRWALISTGPGQRAPGRLMMMSRVGASHTVSAFYRLHHTVSAVWRLLTAQGKTAAGLNRITGEMIQDIA